jgi:hypothetical protein
VIFNKEKHELKINFLTRRYTNLNQIFFILEKTKTGQSLLKEYKLNFEKKIFFKFYPEHILSKLKKILDFGQALGACFVNDGVKGQIYFNPDCEIGVLSILMIHELTHALDIKLWSDDVRSESKKDLILFESELKAYRNQFNFMKELFNLCPMFLEYLKNQYPNSPMLFEETNKNQIKKLYKFEQIL